MWVYMNKARSADVAWAKGLLCIGVAFVPIVGVALAAICAISYALDDIVYRYGWCSKVRFNLLAARTSTFEYYQGGFCT